MAQASSPRGDLGVAEKSSRRNNFDFLRLCFASLVILGHSPALVDGDGHRELLWRAFHTLSFGEIGVAGFFILSGYLISQSWAQRPYLPAFFRNRVLRIYPGYVVAALIGAFVFGPLGANAREYFSLFKPISFVKSVVELGVPLTPPTKIGNGSLWTIQTEFLCYVMVAGLGVTRLSTRPFVMPLLVAAIAMYFLKKGIIFAPYSLAGFFLSGASLYHLRDRVTYTRKGVLIASVVLLIGLAINTVTAWLAVCTAGSYLLFAFAFLPVAALQRLGRRADVSYGTYLYAWPIQCLIINKWPQVSPWVVFAAALPLSATCGLLSWRFVEEPFMRLKARQRPAEIRVSPSRPPDRYVDSKEETTSL